MRKHRRLKNLAASAGVLGSLAAQHAAADVMTPPGLNPGDKFNLVFLSIATTDATDNVPTDYDALVASEAAAHQLDAYAGSPVTWRTLGSFFVLGPSPTANDRFDPVTPIYTLDGDLVAVDGADLYDGSIANPVNVRPDLSVATGGAVWTGATSAGGAAFLKIDVNNTPTNPFDDQVVFNNTFGSANVVVGNPLATSAQWLDSALKDSTETDGFLYAFSNELTVPEAVPESAWVGVLGAAAMAVGAWFRKR